MAIKKLKDYQCPYCGSTRFSRGRMLNRFVQKSTDPLSYNQIVYAQICRRCGTILREFIVNPEDLPDF